MSGHILMSALISSNTVNVKSNLLNQHFPVELKQDFSLI